MAARKKTEPSNEAQSIENESRASVAAPSEDPAAPTPGSKRVRDVIAIELTESPQGSGGIAYGLTSRSIRLQDRTRSGGAVQRIVFDPDLQCALISSNNGEVIAIPAAQVRVMLVKRPLARATPRPSTR